VGVDIEHTLPQPDALAIARRIACPQEVAAMQALSSDKVQAAFYRLWVRKEALLKALGKGLLGEPTLHYVGIEPWPDSGQDLGSSDASGKRWLGADIPAPDHHVATVVFAADAKRRLVRDCLTLAW
jgi:4'-phosphopantetheinyl transferase